MRDDAPETEDEGTVADTLRLFVAISLPDPVKDEIEKAQRQLRSAFPGKLVRWTKREQFHLTLKFLGNVRQSRVSELIPALRETCMPLSELQVCAEGMGFFPDARFPRVIWVGVRDHKNLLFRLHEVVEAGVARVIGGRPDKTFKGHVTLGRIERIRRQDAETLAELVAPISKLSFGEWTANKIELIRSQLSSSGSRYTTLATIPLCGKK
ncbi:MAG TPA: RNA 2',3'-cyclic phosphodiesterase [Verrucomicrobiae bacterium]|nr:RNA 2',3'-cyclic phosphodiesterase [Verrucomicrobiae bacterium]